MSVDDLKSLAHEAERAPYSMTGTKIQRLARALLAGIVEAERLRDAPAGDPGEIAAAQDVLRAMEGV